MGIAKGIDEINRQIDRQNPNSQDDGGVKVKWAKLEDGQGVKARFINELGVDSPNYSPDRDLAVVISEHVNPHDFMRKAACTQDVDGRCFGCEMYRKETKADRDALDGKSWRPKLRFYVNLLIDEGKDGVDPYVAVWSQGVGKQSAFNTIREYFSDTGSISNVTWRMKRQGKGTDTNYVLLPLTPDVEPFDWTGIEPFDLTRVVRELPYAEQQDYYLGFESSPATAAATTNLDWV